jgi:hypothetical protein
MAPPFVRLLSYFGMGYWTAALQSAVNGALAWAGHMVAVALIAPIAVVATIVLTDVVLDLTRELLLPVSE